LGNDVEIILLTEYFIEIILLFYDKMVDVISRDLSRNMSPNIILKLPEKAPPLNGSNSTVSGLWGDNSLGFAKTPIPISGPSPLEVYYGKINPDNIFINKGKDMNKQSM